MAESKVAGRLVAALKQKFATPQDAIVALGLDTALVGNDEEVSMFQLSRTSARRVVEVLKSKGMLALDADPEEVASRLEQIEGVEGKDTSTGGNAGVPPWLSESQEDADPEFETEEERREDEDAARRAIDLRRHLGREASDDEWTRSEEELEFKPDTARAIEGMDRKRIRADDARRRLGRDESEEERAERERKEEAQDRRNARDRARMSLDYRRARDRHYGAMDRVRRAAEDYKRADDARKRADDARREAEDGKKADDARKHAEDVRRAEDSRKRAAEDGQRAYDEMCAARDARKGARDARRAHDRKRRAEDQPSEFRGMSKPGGEIVSKAAMDQAIQDAIRNSDARHRDIQNALETVRPKVGRIAMDGIESEVDVYTHALDALMVPHAGITQIAALRQMFAMAPKPGGERSANAGFAQDSAPEKKQAGFEFFKRVVGDQAANIERM